MTVPLDDDRLAADLAPWLATRRWCDADRAARRQTRIVAVIDDGDLLVTVVQTGTGTDAACWHVPLAAAPDGPFSTGDGRRWVDATEVPDAWRRLAILATTTSSTAGPHGQLVGQPMVGARPPRARGAVRPVTGEQTNTSAAVGDAWVKVLRRVMPGPHPEVQLTRVLTDADTAAVPRHRGSLALASEQGPSTTLVIVADAIADPADAWEAAVAEAAAVAQGSSGGLLATSATSLGAAVGAVHLALADGLGVRRIPTGTAREWAEDAARRASEEIDAIAVGDSPDTTDVMSQLIERQESVASVLRDGAAEMDGAPAIRVHGDLHLGQVVLAGGASWRLIDFEGEPVRDLSTRSTPDTPLRDVAGLLRSVGYAAHAAEQELGEAADRVALIAWCEQVCSDLRTGWSERVSGRGLVPADPAVAARLLALRELEKATYELGYERRLRPTWIALPARGLLDALTRLTTATVRVPAEELAAVADGTHRDPHRVLGPHHLGAGTVVRVLAPGADAVAIDVGSTSHETVDVADGLWAVEVPGHLSGDDYVVTETWPGGNPHRHADGYARLPSVGALDLHLLGEGTHRELGRRLGAQPAPDGVGTTFAVWAPSARSVRVAGDFNGWDGRRHPMRALGGSGVWELTICQAAPGDLYKYEVIGADGEATLRADPIAHGAEVPPGQASRIVASTHTWGDADWLARRGATDPQHAPMSVYEVHLASWRRTSDGASLDYDTLAVDLVAHVAGLGFTHVELLPPAEHPFGGSWGYQVTGHYAPTARLGDPDGFRRLVDAFHAAGIGVIVDWVPAHFPRDAWALARFDGTALYEHPDPRRGAHPDWGTLVFDYGRPEVRAFLISAALYWLEDLHCDGLRVDAVASMLYLDYSRDDGEWAANVHGGREHLEAVSFLQELNTVVHDRVPGVVVVAEESTAWPGVSRPVHDGGLGFTFKWNMGWMHDTLDYMARDPVHRRHHHGQLTFGLDYAFSEHFVLPLSHDEVVHGKGALVAKMPGDDWQRLANLRALLAWMWAHPGKQLVFMGTELAQDHEWAEAGQLDWALAAQAPNAAVGRLIGDLNAGQCSHPALHVLDAEPDGFAWIVADDADRNLLSFRRRDPDGAEVVCVANFAPAERTVRLGLPWPGRWIEVLNTDARTYGGTGVGNLGAVVADETGADGLPAGADVVVGPLAVLWLAHEDGP